MKENPKNESSLFSPFEEVNKDLGTHKTGSLLSFSFVKTDSNREVVSLTPSCGCFNPLYSKEKGEVIVSYRVKGIPEHLKSQGYFYDTKKITVQFNTGPSEVLSFSVKVVK